VSAIADDSTSGPQGESWSTLPSQDHNKNMSTLAVLLPKARQRGSQKPGGPSVSREKISSDVEKPAPQNSFSKVAWVIICIVSVMVLLALDTSGALWPSDSVWQQAAGGLVYSRPFQFSGMWQTKQSESRKAVENLRAENARLREQDILNKGLKAEHAKLTEQIAQCRADALENESKLKASARCEQQLVVQMSTAASLQQEVVAKVSEVESMKAEMLSETARCKNKLEESAMKLKAEVAANQVTSLVGCCRARACWRERASFE
jgi:hypothetical protein